MRRFWVGALMLAMGFAGMDAGDLLERLGIDPRSRPEELGPGDYVRLFEDMRKK